MADGHTIKRGDALTLAWDLDPAPDPGSTARVIIRAYQAAAPLVDRAGTLTGGRVSLDLTSEDTAAAGDYRAEVEVTTAGRPVTWPSDGYALVRIVPDLG